jgi:hypothetical protein
VAAAQSAFDTAKAYYQAVASQLAGIPTNAVHEIKYGNGMFITCSAPSQLYHIKIPAADLSSVDWYSLSGCTFSARWVIDIIGEEDVTIKGQPFPGIVERVIFNVLGNGRTVTGATGVSGHLLAPGNSYTSSAGVSYGLLVANNVVTSLHNALPNCKSFKPVLISTYTTSTVSIGSTTIHVLDVTQFTVGDRICIGGDCHKIVSGEITDSDGDGNPEQTITVETPFQEEHAPDALVTTTVDANEGDDRIPVATVPEQSTYDSASTLVFLALTLVVATFAWF